MKEQLRKENDTETGRGLSMFPLTMDEALAGAMMVKPPAKKRKPKRAGGKKKKK